MKINIKNVAATVWKALTGIFDGLSYKTKEMLPIGIEIVERMMAYDEAGGTDVLVAIIPGDADDKAAAKIRARLPQLLIDLKLAENCVNKTDRNEIVKCGIRTLKETSELARKIFTHGIASVLLEIAADGKLNWKDIPGIVEWIFQKYFLPLKQKNQPVS